MEKDQKRASTGTWYLVERIRPVLGWLAVATSTLLSCFWAFWGVIENFHEGWYHSTLGENLAMLVGQYLMPFLAFTVASLVGIRWPWAGGVLHGAMAGFAAWFFQGASPQVLYPFIVLPLCLIGLGYGFGRPQPRHVAFGLAWGFPCLTIMVFAFEPVYRVSIRIDDGIRSIRRVTGTDVDLFWAPKGPGWPQDGVTWEEAQHICLYLNEAGTELTNQPLGIWRLPTVEEAVRSMRRWGKDCQGIWNPQMEQPQYRNTPDKESPLWDTGSKVIYWWTGTEINDQLAYIIVYDGKVWVRPKKAHWGYLGFRAVKAPKVS